MIIPKDTTKAGIVIEFKKALNDKAESLEEAADRALDQIDQKNYVQMLSTRGIKKIFCYGIAIKGKNVFVKVKSV